MLYSLESLLMYLVVTHSVLTAALRGDLTASTSMMRKQNPKVRRGILPAAPRWLVGRPETGFPDLSACPGPRSGWKRPGLGLHLAHKKKRRGAWRWACFCSLWAGPLLGAKPTKEMGSNLRDGREG